MMNKFNDLLFVIGLFLSIIGGIVLLTGLVGGNDLVQGIRVNLVGGGMLTIVGVAMILRSHFVKA
jgi:hypothetical protein